MLFVTLMFRNKMILVLKKTDSIAPVLRKIKCGLQNRRVFFGGGFPVGVFESQIVGGSRGQHRAAAPLWGPQGCLGTRGGGCGRRHPGHKAGNRGAWVAGGYGRFVSDFVLE